MLNKLTIRLCVSIKVTCETQTVLFDFCCFILPSPYKGKADNILVQLICTVKLYILAASRHLISHFDQRRDLDALILAFLNQDIIWWPVHVCKR